MVYGKFLEFDARNYAVVVVCLRSNGSCANRATVEVLLARSQNCPPKLRPDLYNKGKADMRQLLWDSYQRPWSKMVLVLSKERAVQKNEAAKL